MFVFFSSLPWVEQSDCAQLLAVGANFRAFDGKLPPDKDKSLPPSHFHWEGPAMLDGLSININGRGWLPTGGLSISFTEQWRQACKDFCQSVSMLPVPVSRHLLETSHSHRDHSLSLLPLCIFHDVGWKGCPSSV